MALSTLKGLLNRLSLIKLPSVVFTNTVIWPHSPVENGQLPDPANWGVADVVNYFKATGFEEQATAFQDQVSVVFTPQFHMMLSNRKI